MSACNIAAALPRLAGEAPDQVAMRCPGRRGSDGLARYDVVLTYGELDRRSDAIAAGLAKQGIVRGSRVVVMVRPSPEFFLLMFALLKAGAVPVLVDPGIDKRALKQCLDEAAPEAFIGIPLAQAARALLGWARSARVLVTAGRTWFWGGHTLAGIETGQGVGQADHADLDEVVDLDVCRQLGDHLVGQAPHQRAVLAQHRIDVKTAFGGVRAGHAGLHEHRQLNTGDTRAGRAAPGDNR